MTLVESIWFGIQLFIIVIVLLIDPKNSMNGTSNATIMSSFSSPSSGQSFIYRLSALLITLFYILTIILSYNG